MHCRPTTPHHRSHHLLRGLAALAIAATATVAPIQQAEADAGDNADHALDLGTGLIFDFESGHQGWTVEDLDRGVHDTTWEADQAVPGGGAGFTVTSIAVPPFDGPEDWGERRDGYGDLADTALVSPWITGDGSRLYITALIAHDIEGNGFDHVHVEYRHPDGDWTYVDPATDPIGGETPSYPQPTIVETAFAPDGPFQLRYRLRSDEGNSRRTPLNAYYVTNPQFETIHVDDVFIGTSTFVAPLGQVSALPGRTRPTTTSVVGLVGERGPNPYHAEFRDHSVLARKHPSTYIPGYPTDAVALELTLDAPTLPDALAADADTWNSVTSGQLYWIPGTKFVGLQGTDMAAVQTLLGADFGVAARGTGATWAASRTVGATAGACPDCRIAMFTQKGAGALHAMAPHLPWIDVVAHINDGNDPETVPGLYEDWDVALASVAGQRTTFGPANPLNNGVGYVAQVPTHTVVGTPNYAPGVITVGGQDSGHVDTWNPVGTHLVADPCRAVAATADALVGTDTESVVPRYLTASWAAGSAGQLVLQARTVLRDRGTSMRPEGVLAQATAPNGRPTSGPLADGDLTVDELRELVLQSATRRPAGQPTDGERCDLTTEEPNSLYWQLAASPVRWVDVDDDFPEYATIGYGAIDDVALSLAMDVLQGRAELPDRPITDAWFALDASAREARYALLVHQHAQGILP